MAVLVVNGNGASNTSATYDRASNTPAINAATNLNLTIQRFSATYTAPSTTNAATGLVVFVSTTPTVDISFTLQEASVDTIGTVTVPASTLIAGTLNYIRFTTPYTYTTLTANSYRISAVPSVGAGGGAFSADSGGTLVFAIVTDDRHALPTVGDDVICCGSRTLTITGTTNSWGSGTETAASQNRTIGHALYFSAGGKVAWDKTADTGLQLRGMPYMGTQGTWDRGTVATPIPAGIKSTLTFDQNGVNGNYGVRMNFSQNAVWTEVGTPPATWQSAYVSGTGTTVSPLTVSPALTASVGDNLGIEGATPGTTEERFIETIVSPGVYTLSATKGGAQSGLTNAHVAGQVVANLERNVIVTTSNTSFNYFYLNASNTTVGNVVLYGVRFEYCGMSTSAKQGINIANGASTVAACDYCVSYKPGFNGFQMATSKASFTISNNIVFGINAAATSTAAGFIVAGTANNKTLVDCVAMGLQRTGFAITAYNISMTRCKALACNNIASATVLAGFVFTNAGSLTLTDCEAQANVAQGLLLTGATDTSFVRYISGTRATNAIDILVTTDTYNTLTFSNSLFSSATFISNYLNLIPGSELRFHKLNQTTNNHVWYTNTGSARSTGASLSDTNVRTTGSLALRLTPEDATTGFTWSFNIPSKAMSITNFFGWFQLNVTFTGDVAASARVELWLPDSSAADATTTLSKLTNAFQAAVLSATNTSATDGLAEIRVVGLTTTAAAYVYVDDLYNAGDTLTSTDKVTGLDTWFKGKPLTIIQPSATSAADIWTFPTSGLTTAGTTGLKLVQGSTKGDIASLD